MNVKLKMKDSKNAMENIQRHTQIMAESPLQSFFWHVETGWNTTKMHKQNEYNDKAQRHNTNIQIDR